MSQEWKDLKGFADGSTFCNRVVAFETNDTTWAGPSSWSCPTSRKSVYFGYVRLQSAGVVDLITLFNPTGNPSVKPITDSVFHPRRPYVDNWQPELRMREATGGEIETIRQAVFNGQAKIAYDDPEFLRALQLKKDKYLNTGEAHIVALRP